MSDFIVHLPGPAIRVASVIRQRCAWCGALIEERDLDNIAMPVPDDVPEDERGDWVLRQFVDEDGNPTGGWDTLVAVATHGEHAALGSTAKWAVEDDGGKLPDEACARLPDEATR